MGKVDGFNSPVRDFIDDWPFASEYLQATLDPELIAHHGSTLQDAKLAQLRGHWAK